MAMVVSTIVWSQQTFEEASGGTGCVPESKTPR